MPTKSSIDTSEFKRMVKLVDEHDKILVRGNGKPSLQEDLRTLMKFVEGWQFWSRVVVGLVVTNLVGLIFAAFMWFVKVYPVIERLSRETALVVR